MSNVKDRRGNVKPGRFCVLRFYFGGGRDILVYLMRWTPAASRRRQSMSKMLALSCETTMGKR
jgi:hypothetical protein